MVDEGKYYENGDDVVEVVDVTDGTVTYRLEQVGGAPVSGDKTRTQATDDFELVFDECGSSTTFAGP